MPCYHNQAKIDANNIKIEKLKQQKANIEQLKSRVKEMSSFFDCINHRVDETNAIVSYISAGPGENNCFENIGQVSSTLTGDMTELETYLTELDHTIDQINSAIMGLEHANFRLLGDCGICVAAAQAAAEAAKATK